jgi:sialate O-acetylesterase
MVARIPRRIRTAETQPTAEPMRIASGLLPGHVLQRTPRGASATVRGETAARGPVTATITDKGRPLQGWKARKVGSAGAGRFSAALTGLPTGGPYALTLQAGDERCAVREFYVGDLWLMAGQSNMEGVGNLADAPKPHRLVRNFSMARRWEAGREPLHHLPESPDRVHNGGSQQPPAVAAQAKRTRLKGTGVGVWFANEMLARTGVPQGLIATAHGGTNMDQWDPARRGLGGGSLYGSLLASLAAVDQPLAGVLWYQGEGDANPAAVPLYTPRMQRLVAAVRSDQRQPRLPWVVVQIGRHIHDGGHREWNGVQEQERLLPRVIRHLDVVPAVDLELDDVIHVSGKAHAILGQRMARVAARLAHGDRREAPAIQPVAARVMEGSGNARIEIRFANVVGGLRSGCLPGGLVFVDADHKPHDLAYKTVLDGDRAVLHLTGPLERGDLRLMYGWGRNPRCTLVDARGMAVPVFGPLRLAGQHPVSPWFSTWDVSAILPGEDIARLPRPTPKTVGGVERKAWPPSPWGGAFVDQHQQWQGKSGHAAFFGGVEVPEAMAVELRTGFDGPFRCWLGDKEVHRDLHGTNPAVLDSRRIPLRLRAGRHRLTVLMALNHGNAWGFFLRFARTDVPDSQRERGSFALPVPAI